MMQVALKNLMLSVVLVIIVQEGYAQGGKSSFAHPISDSDSALVQRYMDSLNVIPLFSRKHQLYFDSALAIMPWKASWWQQKAMPLYKRKKYQLGALFLD